MRCYRRESTAKPFDIMGEADITIDLFTRTSIFILTKLVLVQETNNTSQFPLYMPQSISETVHYDAISSK